ncbi:zinc-dependent alcohol dehydrogenase [Deinococcus aestuarii]|uniref:zinc-dependent alcohol dehydrogenase n=1 Tax=Deinococcus aestuarii TaxID=2774531 RepID=UPI001C0B7894|nr:zinc-dependent alcohol dehydrogenase [Deinococcus aestuarii]
MKAVVWHGVGDIRLEDVPDPRIEQPTDAIVRLTASAICGTDLHFVHGTFSEMVPGTILGHEGVGIVEEVGADVRNFRPGDRVVIPSTMGCGYCPYCRAGDYSQCDNANPNGPSAGTAFYGGPKASGPVQGLQAEKARVPFAAINLVKIPDAVTDGQAILVSDIFPTGYFGAELAEIKPGDTVAVFGCGPVGQFAITSAKLMGAGRVFAVDRIPDRLETASDQGAEAINFDEEDPVETLKRLTGGTGVDRVIDAVGVDAQHADHGPAAQQARQEAGEFEEQLSQVAPDGTAGNVGNAPSQALEWAVQSVCKAGTLSIIGVYPPTMQSFPIGAAMNKNLTIKMGNTPHRKYIPYLLDLIQQGTLDPEGLLSRAEEMSDVLSAYRAFDERRPGWLKVELVPGM